MVNPEYAQEPSKNPARTHLRMTGRDQAKPDPFTFVIAASPFARPGSEG